MGAVTAIFTASTTSVNCIVCDSAFSSLSLLINEYVNRSFPLIPQWMIDLTKRSVSETVYTRAGFHIDEINPIESSKLCGGIPAFFCHAVNDTFISPNHCKQLFSSYAGEKEMIMFDGDHNSKRPYHVLQVISLFFFDKLKVESIEELSIEFDLNNNKVKNKKNIEKKKTFSEKDTDDVEVVDNENYIYETVKSIKSGITMGSRFNTDNNV